MGSYLKRRTGRRRGEGENEKKKKLMAVLHTCDFRTGGAGLREKWPQRDTSLGCRCQTCLGCRMRTYLRNQTKQRKDEAVKGREGGREERGMKLE